MKESLICSCRRAFGSSLVKGALALPFMDLIARAHADEKSAAGVPGSSRTMKSHVLDAGADALQSKKPINAMSEYLNGFHFYADDMGRQVEANHFCSHLTEDFHQCVIYDSNESDAKLIGIEYIVSERIFKSLPDDEKRLWHSHNYEVTSGELIAPNVPNIAENAFMKDLVTTYGKTWHTWQIDRDHAFPMGIPQLMMGFTQDGQVNKAMVSDRDQRFGVSSSNEKENRRNIANPTLVAGANSWETGKTVQLRLAEVSVKNVRG